MVLKTIILTYLLSLPWTKSDRATETIAEREQRLETIAASVADAANGDHLKAAYVLTHMQRETDFDRAVQSCECKPHQCDARKTADGIEFRAHSLAQAHETGFRDLASWWQLCGTARANVDANVRFILLFYRPTKLACSYSTLAGMGPTGCATKLATGRERRARALARRFGGAR